MRQLLSVDYHDEITGKEGANELKSKSRHRFRKGRVLDSDDGPI